MLDNWGRVGSRSKLFSCSGAHLSFTLLLTFVKYNPIQSRWWWWWWWKQNKVIEEAINYFSVIRRLRTECNQVESFNDDVWNQVSPGEVPPSPKQPIKNSSLISNWQTSIRNIIGVYIELETICWRRPSPPLPPPGNEDIVGTSGQHGKSLRMSATQNW